MRDTSGLLYYRARFYDPEIGRFLNPDPIRFEGGINFYAYANNNPVTLTDPTGEVVPLIFAPPFIGAAAGAISAGLTYALTADDASLAGLSQAAAAGGTAGFIAGLPLTLGPAGTLGFAALVGGGANVVTQGFTQGPENIGLGQAAIFAGLTAFAAVPSAGIAASGFELPLGASALFAAAEVPKAVAFDTFASNVVPQDDFTAGEAFGAAQSALSGIQNTIGLVPDFFNGSFGDISAPSPPAPKPPPISSMLK